MAKDIILDVHGNTKPLTRAIERDISKLSRSSRLELNDKNFSQPLGRITGQVGEFDKALEASNARVLAFAASAGVLYAVQKGFQAVFSSMINVEKKLADINVLFGASQSSLNKFGAELFNVAQITGQGFNDVAEAATELARQGLSATETLKRTRDALILTRLTGMDAADAVSALTAALNSFSRAAIDSTEYVSKLAAVDAAFAVGSDDLAKAVSRVGSSAQEAGVSIDQLIAIVTSAQQITARGGAVIGNSFKTIFTRIQRPRVLKQLRELGIEVDDVAGRIRPAISILQDLAQTYDTLAQAQQAQIAELIGGVFQVNVLKASLRDLGKEFSLYGNALKISNGATDEAIRRNEELNKTVAASLNSVVQSFTKFGAQAGESLLGPLTRRVAGIADFLFKGLDLKEADDFGSKLAKGMFGAIGKFLSSGGLIIGVKVLFNAIREFGKYAVDGVKKLSGAVGQSQRQLKLQEAITQELSRQPQLLEQLLQGEISAADAAKKLHGSLRQNTRELEFQKDLVESLGKHLGHMGVRTKGGVGEAVDLDPASFNSRGFVPNFVNSNDAISAAVELSSASYAKPSTKAIKTKIQGVGGITMNSEEKVVKHPAFKQPFINPPITSPEGRMHRKRSKEKTGIDPYASSGFIPNFRFNPKPENFKNALSWFYKEKSNDFDDYRSLGEVASEFTYRAGMNRNHKYFTTLNKAGKTTKTNLFEGFKLLNPNETRSEEEVFSSLLKEFKSSKPAHGIRDTSRTDAGDDLEKSLEIYLNARASVSDAAIDFPSITTDKGVRALIGMEPNYSVAEAYSGDVSGHGAQAFIGKSMRHEPNKYSVDKARASAESNQAFSMGKLTPKEIIGTARKDPQSVLGNFETLNFELKLKSLGKKAKTSIVLRDWENLDSGKWLQLQKEYPNLTVKGSYDKDLISEPALYAQLGAQAARGGFVPNFLNVAGLGELDPDELEKLGEGNFGRVFVHPKDPKKVIKEFVGDPDEVTIGGSREDFMIGEVLAREHLNRHSSVPSPLMHSTLEEARANRSIVMNRVLGGETVSGFSDRMTTKHEKTSSADLYVWLRPYGNGFMSKIRERMGNKLQSEGYTGDFDLHGENVMMTPRGSALSEEELLRYTERPYSLGGSDSKADELIDSLIKSEDLIYVDPGTISNNTNIPFSELAAKGLIPNFISEGGVLDPKLKAKASISKAFLDNNVRQISNFKYGPKGKHTTSMGRESGRSGMIISASNETGDLTGWLQFATSGFDLGEYPLVKGGIISISGNNNSTGGYLYEKPKTEEERKASRGSGLARMNALQNFARENNHSIKSSVLIANENLSDLPHKYDRSIQRNNSRINDPVLLEILRNLSLNEEDISELTKAPQSTSFSDINASSTAYRPPLPGGAPAALPLPPLPPPPAGKSTKMSTTGKSNRKTLLQEALERRKELDLAKNARIAKLIEENYESTQKDKRSPWEKYLKIFPQVKQRIGELGGKGFQTEGSFTTHGAVNTASIPRYLSFDSLQELYKEFGEFSAEDFNKAYVGMVDQDDDGYYDFDKYTILTESNLSPKIQTGDLKQNPVPDGQPDDSKVPFSFGGFVPNFKKEEKKLRTGHRYSDEEWEERGGGTRFLDTIDEETDKNVGTLDYEYSGERLRVGYNNSNRKGAGFSQFKALTDISREKGLPIYSGTLQSQMHKFIDPSYERTPEKDTALTKEILSKHNSTYSALISKYIFPQVRHRMQDGLITSGKFWRDGSFEDIDFNSLKELKNEINKVYTPDLLDDAYDSQVSMYRLNTKPVEEDKPDDNFTAFKGLIPNFASKKEKAANIAGKTYKKGDTIASGISAATLGVEAFTLWATREGLKFVANKLQNYKDKKASVNQLTDILMSNWGKTELGISDVSDGWMNKADGHNTNKGHISKEEIQKFRKEQKAKVANYISSKEYKTISGQMSAGLNAVSGKSLSQVRGKDLASGLLRFDDNSNVWPEQVEGGSMPSLEGLSAMKILENEKGSPEALGFKTGVSPYTLSHGYHKTSGGHPFAIRKAGSLNTEVSNTNTDKRLAFMYQWGEKSKYPWDKRTKTNFLKPLADGFVPNFLETKPVLDREIVDIISKISRAEEFDPDIMIPLIGRNSNLAAYITNYAKEKGIGAAPNDLEHVGPMLFKARLESAASKFARTGEPYVRDVDLAKADRDLIQIRNREQRRWIKHQVEARDLDIGDPDVITRLGKEYARENPSDQRLFDFGYAGHIPNFLDIPKPSREKGGGHLVSMLLQAANTQKIIDYIKNAPELYKKFKEAVSIRSYSEDETYGGIKEAVSGGHIPSFLKIPKDSSEKSSPWGAKMILETPELLKKFRDFIFNNLEEISGAYIDGDLGRLSGDNSVSFGGHIPNFSSALDDAINRENRAGIPMKNIRVGKDKSLKNSKNPNGLGVWNDKQENSLRQGIQFAKNAGIDPKKKGASRGHVPNFIRTIGDEMELQGIKTPAPPEIIKSGPKLEAPESPDTSSIKAINSLLEKQQAVLSDMLSNLSSANNSFEGIATSVTGLSGQLSGIEGSISSLGNGFDKVSSRVREVSDGITGIKGSLEKSNSALGNLEYLSLESAASLEEAAAAQKSIAKTEEDRLGDERKARKASEAKAKAAEESAKAEKENAKALSKRKGADAITTAGNLTRKITKTKRGFKIEKSETDISNLKGSTEDKKSVIESSISGAQDRIKDLEKELTNYSSTLKNGNLEFRDSTGNVSSEASALHNELSNLKSASTQLEKALKQAEKEAKKVKFQKEAKKEKPLKLDSKSLKGMSLEETMDADRGLSAAMRQIESSLEEKRKALDEGTNYEYENGQVTKVQTKTAKEAADAITELKKDQRELAAKTRKVKEALNEKIVQDMNSSIGEVEEALQKLGKGASSMDFKRLMNLEKKRMEEAAGRKGGKIRQFGRGVGAGAKAIKSKFFDEDDISGDFQQKMFYLSAGISTVSGMLDSFGEEGSTMNKSISGLTEGVNAATGLMTTFPGPWGRMIGVFAGVGVAVNGIMKAIADGRGEFLGIQGLNVEGLKKKADQSKESFTKLQNNITAYANAFSELKAAAKDFNTPAEQIARLNKKVEDLIASVPAEFAADLAAINDPAELQAKIAEIIAEQQKKAASVQFASDTAGRASEATSWRNLWGIGGNATRNQFEGSAGAISADRAATDLAANIDFTRLQDGLDSSAQGLKKNSADQLLAANSSQDLANILQVQYGATEEMAAAIRSMNAAEMNILRKRLVDMANAARRSREALEKIGKVRRKVSSDLEIDKLQLAVQAAQINIEQEAKMMGLAGGGIEGFKDPGTLDGKNDALDAALIALNASRTSGSSSDAVMGQGRAVLGLVEGMRDIPGLIPTVDDFGNMESSWESFRDSVAAGIEENIKTRTQQTLDKFRDARSKATNQTDISILDKNIKLLEQRLADTDFISSAAKQQANEAIGAVGIERKIVTVPSGDSVQAQKKLGDILKENGIKGNKSANTIADANKKLNDEIQRLQDAIDKEKAKTNRDQESKDKEEKLKKARDTLTALQAAGGITGATTAEDIGKLRTLDSEGKERELFEKGQLKIGSDLTPAQKVLIAKQDELKKATEKLTEATLKAKEDVKKDQEKEKTQEANKELFAAVNRANKVVTGAGTDTLFSGKPLEEIGLSGMVGQAIHEQAANLGLTDWDEGSNAADRAEAASEFIAGTTNWRGNQDRTIAGGAITDAKGLIEAMRVVSHTMENKLGREGSRQDLESLSLGLLTDKKGNELTKDSMKEALRQKLDMNDEQATAVLDKIYNVFKNQNDGPATQKLLKSIVESTSKDKFSEMNEMAQMATTKGSIYTHDTHLEKKMDEGMGSGFGVGNLEVGVAAATLAGITYGFKKLKKARNAKKAAQAGETVAEATKAAKSSTKAVKGTTNVAKESGGIVKKVKQFISGADTATDTSSGAAKLAQQMANSSNPAVRAATQTGKGAAKAADAGVDVARTFKSGKEVLESATKGISNTVDAIRSAPTRLVKGISDGTNAIVDGARALRANPALAITKPIDAIQSARASRAASGGFGKMANMGKLGKGLVVTDLALLGVEAYQLATNFEGMTSDFAALNKESSNLGRVWQGFTSPLTSTATAIKTVGEYFSITAENEKTRIALIQKSIGLEQRAAINMEKLLTATADASHSMANINDDTLSAMVSGIIKQKDQEAVQAGTESTMKALNEAGGLSSMEESDIRGKSRVASQRMAKALDAGYAKSQSKANRLEFDKAALLSFNRLATVVADKEEIDREDVKAADVMDYAINNQAMSQEGMDAVKRIFASQGMSFHDSGLFKVNDSTGHTKIGDVLNQMGAEFHTATTAASKEFYAQVQNSGVEIEKILDKLGMTQETFIMELKNSPAEFSQKVTEAVAGIKTEEEIDKQAAAKTKLKDEFLAETESGKIGALVNMDAAISTLQEKMKSGKGTKEDAAELQKLQEQRTERARAITNVRGQRGDVQAAELNKLYQDLDKVKAARAEYGSDPHNDRMIASLEAAISSYTGDIGGEGAARSSQMQDSILKALKRSGRSGAAKVVEKNINELQDVNNELKELETSNLGEDDVARTEKVGDQTYTFSKAEERQRLLEKRKKIMADQGNIMAEASKDPKYLAALQDQRKTAEVMAKAPVPAAGGAMQSAAEMQKQLGTGTLGGIAQNVVPVLVTNWPTMLGGGSMLDSTGAGSQQPIPPVVQAMQNSLGSSFSTMFHNLGKGLGQGGAFGYGTGAAGGGGIGNFLARGQASDIFTSASSQLGYQQQISQLMGGFDPFGGARTVGVGPMTAVDSSTLPAKTQPNVPMRIEGLTTLNTQLQNLNETLRTAFLGSENKENREDLKDETGSSAAEETTQTAQANQPEQGAANTEELMNVVRALHQVLLASNERLSKSFDSLNIRQQEQFQLFVEGLSGIVEKLTGGAIQIGGNATLSVNHAGTLDIGGDIKNKFENDLKDLTAQIKALGGDPKASTATPTPPREGAGNTQV